MFLSSFIIADLFKIDFLYNLLSIVVGIGGISFLVLIHELGHFFFCKLFAIHTPSFSIGFGPRLWTKKIGDTIFALSALPFGGYVEIAGSAEPGQGEQKYAGMKGEGSFISAPYWHKMLILLGGIIANISFAFLGIAFFFALNRQVPSYPILASLAESAQITEVIAGSPAEKAGLKPGYLITGASSRRARCAMKTDGGLPALNSFLREHGGEEVKISIIDETSYTATTGPDGIHIHNPEVSVTLDQNPNHPLGALLSMNPCLLEGPFLVRILSPFQQSARLLKHWTTAIFASLSQMISRRSTAGLGGPIAVVHQIAIQAKSGASALFLILCFISLSLACLNILPLPILDGGQLLLCTVETIIQHPLGKVREWLNTGCLIAFILLFLGISWRDLAAIAGTKTCFIVAGLTVTGLVAKHFWPSLF